MENSTFLFITAVENNIFNRFNSDVQSGDVERNTVEFKSNQNQLTVIFHNEPWFIVEFFENSVFIRGLNLGHIIKLSFVVEYKLNPANFLSMYNMSMSCNSHSFESEQVCKHLFRLAGKIMTRGIKIDQQGLQLLSECIGDFVYDLTEYLDNY